MKFFFLFIFFVSQNFAQNSKAEMLLSKIKEDFFLKKNFKVQFIQTVKQSNRESEFSIKGNFYFSNGNGFKIELKNQIIVSDGKTLWNYNKTQNRTLISNYRDGLNAFSLKKIFEEYPKICTLKYKTTDTEEKIVLVPRKENFEFKQIDLIINNSTLKKIVITDNSETIYITQLYDYQFNLNLTKNYFMFISPEGAKIVDLR